MMNPFSKTEYCGFRRRPPMKGYSPVGQGGHGSSPPPLPRCPVCVWWGWGGEAKRGKRTRRMIHICCVTIYRGYMESKLSWMTKGSKKDPTSVVICWGQIIVQCWCNNTAATGGLSRNSFFANCMRSFCTTSTCDAHVYST